MIHRMLSPLPAVAVLLFVAQWAGAQAYPGSPNSAGATAPDNTKTNRQMTSRTGSSDNQTADDQKEALRRSNPRRKARAACSKDRVAVPAEAGGTWMTRRLVL